MPRLKIPAFLLLLICGISPAFTQSDRPKRQPGLWQKALLPIAPESPSPETRPQRAATALIAWTRILGETIKNPHWDAHSGPYIRSLQEDLSRLDLSAAYNHLPKKIPGGRAVILRGRWSPKGFSITQSDTKAPPFDSFGDSRLEMRCFPLPVNHLKKASYRIELDMKLDTGGLSPDRFVLILRRLLQAIVLGTHNQKSTRIRSSRKTESLSRDGRALLQSFRKDYPELTRRALSVAHIERLCTYHENLAENPGVLYQSDLRWDQKGLQDLFEDLADYLEDLEGLYHIEGEVRHKSGRLTDFFFGSDPMLWRVRFFTSESKLFAVAPGPKGPKLTAVDLLEHRTNTLEAKIHQRYSFDGLRIEIDGLPIAIRTENRPGSLRTQLQLNRMPDATRVGGKLWGFLDKNVIDFFIPSNIDQLTSDFLGTLTRGNEGQGSTIDIHFTQEAGRNLIHIQSRNEILDNGLIPFAYEMYRARFEPDRAVRNDIAGLLHLLERGLERDLRAPQKR